MHLPHSRLRKKTEVRNGTTGTQLDSDNDGLIDSWEISYFSNLSQTATGDFDLDGCDNLCEMRRGTNPRVGDTDGDGLDDNKEVYNYGTDPLVADTDGDGLNALRMREADLSRHLSNDREAEVSKERRDELEEQARILALEKKRKPLEYGSAGDFQLAQALNHLKGLPVQTARPGSAIMQAAVK